MNMTVPPGTNPRPNRPRQPAPNRHAYSPAYAINGCALVSGALPIDTHGNAVGGWAKALDAAMDRMTERLATSAGVWKTSSGSPLARRT